MNVVDLDIRRTFDPERWLAAWTDLGGLCIIGAVVPGISDHGGHNLLILGPTHQPPHSAEWRATRCLRAQVEPDERKVRLVGHMARLRATMGQG